MSWIERTLRRDEVIVGAGLLAIAGLAWIYLARMAAAMNGAAAEAAMHAAMGMSMPGMDGPVTAELGGLWLMWTLMMIAMMLPSAAPTALLVLGVYRRRADTRARMCSYLFALGYLLVWAAFSAAAAGAQVAMRRAAMLSPEMATTSRVFAALVLIGAGIYQWLPIKNACLAHCRSPLEFLSRHWREGSAGAIRMGVRHGAFCVGCCWALMALLFVAGVMNLLWVAAIALFVLIEKRLDATAVVSRIGGVLLVGWGLAAAFLRIQ